MEHLSEILLIQRGEKNEFFIQVGEHIFVIPDKTALNLANFILERIKGLPALKYS
jgi:hypothetical protein